MRLLSDYEIKLVAGGDGSTIYVDSNPWFDITASGPTYVGPTGDGGTGSGTSTSTAGGNVVATDTKTCSAASGAALEAAHIVTGQLPPGVSGPPNALQTASGNTWQTVEFGALIVNNGNGTYGAYQDAIFSDNAVNGVNMHWDPGANVVGDWHTHPASDGPKGDYPSDSSNTGPNDWDALQSIKNSNPDPNFDPSMWITGPDGVTREFKLSQRSFYEGLTDAQKLAGEGLQNNAVTTSCVW